MMLGCKAVLRGRYEANAAWLSLWQDCQLQRSATLKPPARRPLTKGGPTAQNHAGRDRRAPPGVPIVASLRRRDQDVGGADYNCPADNPPLSVRTIKPPEALYDDCTKPGSCL